MCVNYIFALFLRNVLIIFHKKAGLPLLDFVCKQNFGVFCMKTKINMLSLVVLAVLFAALNTWSADLSGNATDGWYINMPASGTTTLEIKSDDITNGLRSFKVYDDGGSNGDYSNNAAGTLKITAPTNYILVLSGTIRTQYVASGKADYLNVSDGNGTLLLGNAMSDQYHGVPTDIGPIVSSTNGLSLYFASNTSMTYAGLDLTVEIINPSSNNLVTINQKTGGTISTDKNSATYGTIVSLTKTLSSGYLLKDIEVKDANNNLVKVNGGLWYSNDEILFNMPSSNVTVTPAYTNAWTATGGLHVEMPRTGTKQITIPEGVESFKVYDAGGSEGDLLPGSAGYIELTAPDDDHLLRVTGTVTVNNSSYTYLTIYDGDKNANALLDQKNSSDAGVATEIGNIVSHSKKLTLYLYASPYSLASYPGIDLTVEVIEASASHGIIAPANVTVSDAAATVHSSVSIEVTPEDGYLLTGVTVIADGNSIDVNGGTWYTENKGSFIMPYADVEIIPAYTNDLTAEGGLEARLPTIGAKTLELPKGVKSFKLYDDGGAGGAYGANADGSVVLVAPTDSIFLVTGIVNLKNWSEDQVTIFDGNESDDELFSIDGNHSADEDVDVGKIYSTGNTLTVKLENKDGYNYYAKGLDLTVALVKKNVPHEIVCAVDGGGEIACEKTSAIIGEPITVKLTAEKGNGYYLADLEIYDEDGNELSAIIDRVDSVYTVTFDMPYSKVNVKPHFAKENEATFAADGRLNNYTYFHMSCDADTKSCTISQGILSNDQLKRDEKKDFTYWFRNTNDPDDVCASKTRYASVYIYKECEYGLIDMYNAYYKGYSLVLESDLNFGGEENGLCAMQFVPFEGSTDASFQNVELKIQGNNHEIKGLCQTSVAQSGFVYATNQAVSVSNVKFTNAYIVNEGFSGAGVVAAQASAGITLSDVKVVNSTVHASANVGGLVGSAVGTISIQNSSFEGKVSGKGPNARIGGLVGNANTSNMIIENSFVESDVANTSSQLTPGGKTNNYVGGLVGIIGDADDVTLSGNVDLTIKNTYSKGNVSSAASTLNSNTDKVGYIVGYITYRLIDGSRIVNNYHFGEDEIELGVGGIERISGYGADSWKEGFSLSYGNVRNAYGSLVATSSFGYHLNDMYDYSGYIGYYVDFFAGTLRTDDYYALLRTANGIVSSTDMKSGLLSALMNYNLEAEGKAALWANVHESDESPMFATSSAKTNHLVVVKTKVLSANEANTLDLEPVHEYFINDNNNYSSGVDAYGFTAYTDTNGNLIDVFKGKVAELKYAVAEKAGIDSALVAITDETGNYVSMTNKISSSQVWSLSAPLSYQVVYRYCDADPSSVTANCEEIDNISNKTFIFMSPRVDVLYTNASIERTIIPMVYVLDEKVSLQYGIEYLNETGIWVSIQNNLSTPYRLASDVVNAATDLKKIRLNYFSAANAGWSENILVENPAQVKFTIEMSGDAANGASHEIVDVVSNINQNTQKPADVNVPFTRYLKVKDIICGSGYTCDGYYSISFYVGKTSSCNNEPADTTNIEYTATADEILDGVSDGCSVATWRVDDSKSKNDNEVGDEIDLTNALVAMVKDAGASSFALSVSPNRTPIEYTVTFDISSLDAKQIVFGYLKDGWKSEKPMSLEADKSFPRMYLMQVRNGAPEFTDYSWATTQDETEANFFSSKVLNPALLERVQPSATGEFTLYPNAGRSSYSVIQVAACDVYEEGNGCLRTTTDSSDYHGRVIISQAIISEENAYMQKSDTCVVGSHDDGNGNEIKEYNHCLYLPDVKDTLIYKVTLDPDPGFTMSILNEGTNFVTGWNDKSLPASEGWGLNAQKDTLKIQPYYMQYMENFIVKYTISGPFYVTYDLNTPDSKLEDLYFPVDATANDSLKFTESVTQHDLWQPSRSDKMCFDGWSVKDPSVATAYDKVKTIYAYFAAENLSAKSDSPTKLYANWSTCVDGPTTKITIANGNTKSVPKLKQTFDGTEYEHNLENGIVLADGEYDFTVDAENSGTKFGYAVTGDVSATVKVTNSDDSESQSTDVALTGSVIKVVTNVNDQSKPSSNTIYTLNLNTTTVPLNFAFNVNTTTGTVFYGDDWKKTVDGVRADDTENPLPQHIAQLNKCFDGWAGKSTSTDAFTTLSEDFLQMLGEETPVEVAVDGNTTKQVYNLYAVWRVGDGASGCQPAVYTVNTNVTKDVGSFKIFQIVDGDTIARKVSFGLSFYQLKDEHYEFFVEFVPSAAYRMTDASKITAAYADAVGSESIMTEEIQNSYVFETRTGAAATATAITLDVSDLGLKTLEFALDLNAGDAKVFYGSTYKSTLELTEDDYSKAKLPLNVYRTDAKLVGWTFERMSGTMGTLDFFTEFDGTFVEEYALRKMNLSADWGDTLFAVWENVDGLSTYTISMLNADKEGCFELTNKAGELSNKYEIGESGLTVPAVDDIEFSVEFTPTEEYVYDSSFVVYDANGDSVIYWDSAKEPSSKIHSTTSMGLKANVLKNQRVQFVLNDNSEDQVFFGSDWIDTLASENPDSDLELPKIAYNSAKCLAGWTIDSTSNKLLTVLDKDLLNDLRAKGNAQGRSISELLYAKWTTNLDSCAGDFMKLAIEQENGSVWFVEDDKDKTIKRDFTEDGTMFVPLELDGRKFRVQASGVDTSVYVLDSLVVLRNSKVDTVLFVGDLMPEVLDSTMSLKAYFGWKNKTKLEIVRSRLASSGAMFKLSFKASDFEVRRHVSAWVGVYDAVKDSIVRSFDLGDSVVMGYDTAFVFPMRKPGNYRMVVTLEDQTGLKDTLSRDFSVDPEIASVAADSWQMLSLSAVDMSSIKKDGDQIFYWWDDQGLGEFWQYKQLDLNDPVDATVGVWYNSLEGRPLVLRDEIDDEGDDFAWKLDCAKTGWNLVANPHGWAVSLFASYPEIAKDVDENSEVIFWKWNTETGNYDPMPRDIGPYEAVWAQVTKKTEWKVSAEPVFEPETINALEKSRALVKATTKDRWTLQAVLSDEKGKRDSWNILGAGLNPIAADEPPEGMGDHVNLSIVEGKRALAKSIKEANDELEWTVALSASSNRIGYLSFAGIDGVKSFGYRVFVTIDGNTTEVQEGVPLKVYLKTTAKTATVRVAPAARVVAQNSLKGLRMARLGGKLKVSFDATGLAGTNARVDILDMKGNVISTVTAKTLEGANALVLDAPQTGLYMLRVRAGSKQQATKVVVR